MEPVVCNRIVACKVIVNITYLSACDESGFRVTNLFHYISSGFTADLRACTESTVSFIERSMNAVLLARIWHFEDHAMKQ